MTNNEVSLALRLLCCQHCDKAPYGSRSCHASNKECYAALYVAHNALDKNKSAWYMSTNKVLHCGNCSKDAINNKKTEFCPFCGCHMDEEVVELK